jgi:Fe-S cluster assembly protein SufD
VLSRTAHIRTIADFISIDMTESTLAASSAQQSSPKGILEGPSKLSHLPLWFTEDAARAWERFQSLSMPVRTEEKWRFSGVAKLALEGWRTGSGPVDPALAEQALGASLGVCGSMGQMIFLNDRLAARRHAAAELEERGVVWKPMEQALHENEDVIRRHFMAHSTNLGGAKFAALHRAFAVNGGFLHVPAGVKLELPLEHFYWVHGENAACFPHTLIIAEPGSSVTVIDNFASLDPAMRNFTCGVNDLYLGPGASVTYVSIQNWSRGSLAFQFNSIVADKESASRALNLHLGAHYARSESVSRLIGPGASSEMLAVTHACEDQEFDQRTLQDHQQPHTRSDLLYKNALDNKARTIFSGLIKVERGAHYTDAYQKVRNLLLSDEADANSMPGLEILADQVRCTHGATSGQIDEEELFYLRSRGIDKATAAKLIMLGFLAEVFMRLDNAPIQERLNMALKAKVDSP